MTSADVALIVAIGAIIVLVAILACIAIFAWRAIRSADRELRNLIDLPSRNGEVKRGNH